MIDTTVQVFEPPFRQQCGTCAWWEQRDTAPDFGADGSCFYEPEAHHRGSECKACHHWTPAAEDAADYQAPGTNGEGEG